MRRTPCEQFGDIATAEGICVAWSQEGE